MRFNEHSHLRDKHAVVSASKYHWLNYSDEKFDTYMMTQMAARRGTELHEFASFAIRLGEKLQSRHKTLNMYVNDSIGFRMKPELVLYYSDNAFGTADAISFRRNKLRISDLKTGVSPTSEKQLEIYAALFCLEYRVKPEDIDIELRIYQNDECREYEGEVDRTHEIMERITRFDKRATLLRMEADQ